MFLIMFRHTKFVSIPKSSGSVEIVTWRDHATPYHAIWRIT